MKNTLAALTIAATLCASGLIYPATMRVVSVKNETVTLATSEGIVYEMYSDGDWMPGDLASVIMFTNGSEVIYDDSILAAQYSGFTVANTARP